MKASRTFKREHYIKCVYLDYFEVRINMEGRSPFDQYAPNETFPIKMESEINGRVKNKKVIKIQS